MNLNTLEFEVLPVPFYTLTLCGIWCPQIMNSFLRRIYSFFTYFVIAAELSLTICVIVQFIIIISINEFELDVFFIMTSLINGLYKGINILTTRKKIIGLLTRGFQDHWRLPKDDSEERILKRYATESLKIHLTYAGACLAGVSIKLMGPMMKTNADIELPTPAWYPYNINKTHYFWISYMQQMFCGGAIISMHIGADTMLCGFILQSCVHVQILKYRLKNFAKLCQRVKSHPHCTTSDLEVEKKLLNKFINDHQFTYSFAKEVNKNFSGWLLAVLTVVVPNICINVYLLSFYEIGMNIDIITSLGLFSISLFQIYLPCWYGNEVTLNSMDIGNAIYEMDWVDLKPSTKKTLIIIMIRAIQPIRLTVARIIPMNIKSFLSIMKTSYSALSVLQQV